MRILVCMKAVPATAQVRVDEQFRLERDGASLQWNIADESALEAAVRLKGQTGSVTVLTMGPQKLEEPLRDLLARGADHAVLVTDPLMAGADTYATAEALLSAVKALGEFDLILCGRRALDGETGQVPGMLAAGLDRPCVTNVEQLSAEEDYLMLRRRLENGIEVLRAQLPVVVSVCEYSYLLRLPGIMGMRRAKQQQIQRLCAADLDLPAHACGLKGSLTRVVAMSERFPGLRKGPKQTDIAVGAAEVLKLCREVVG